MQNEMGSLRIVVLESPYDTWHVPQTENLFRDLIGIKLRGYGLQYPYGVLPVDGADLISTHLLLCRETGEKLQPLMGARWTSMSKCQSHFLNFPGLSLVQQAGSVDHVQAIEAIMQSARERKSELWYMGSFTIDPKERGDKALSVFYREVLTLMFVRYQQETAPSELLAGGTVRFKMDNYIRDMGHQCLQKNGVDLGPIHVKHLAGEDVLVMHLKKFSFAALQTARKWDQLWNERLVISASSHGVIQKVA